MLLAAMSAAGAVTGAIARYDGAVAEHMVLRNREDWVPRDTMIDAGLYSVSLDDEVSQDFLRLLPTSEHHWITASDTGWIPAPYRNFHRDQGTPMLCLVPLCVERRLVGWMGLGFDEMQPPTQASNELLRFLSDQITLSVEMDRLAQEAQRGAVALERELAAQRRANELARANDALRRSVARLAESRSLAEFLKHLLSETIQLLDGAIAQIFCTTARAIPWQPTSESVGLGILPLRPGCCPQSCSGSRSRLTSPLRGSGC